MEFEIIEKQLNQILEDIQVMAIDLSDRVSISGGIRYVNEYLNAFEDIEGRTKDIKLILSKLENPDEPWADD